MVPASTSLMSDRAACLVAVADTDRGRVPPYDLASARGPGGRFEHEPIGALYNVRRLQEGTGVGEIEDVALDIAVAILEDDECRLQGTASRFLPPFRRTRVFGISNVLLHDTQSICALRVKITSDP
jgi:hypothetical protein